MAHRRPASRPPGLLSPEAVLAVVAHPELWVTAARVGLATAEPGWWRRSPRRPALPGSYAEFRRETMWGSDAAGRLGGDDVVAYLRWCREMRSLRLWSRAPGRPRGRVRAVLPVGRSRRR